MAIRYLPSTKQSQNKPITITAKGMPTKETFRMFGGQFRQSYFIEVAMDIGFTPNFIQCIYSGGGGDTLVIYNREANGSLLPAMDIANGSGSSTDARVYHLSVIAPSGESGVSAVWYGEAKNVYVTDKGFKIPVQRNDVDYTIVIM